jgi:hypothetical protein
MIKLITIILAITFSLSSQSLLAQENNVDNRIKVDSLIWSNDNTIPTYPHEAKLDSDLNAQADEWCKGTSAERRCPEDPQLSVGEAFLQEQPGLLALPDNPFDTREHVVVRAQKTPYVRFDSNDYSVPHQHVQTSLTVNACLKEVRIISGTNVIATHLRSFSKGEQIENEAHVNALWLMKTNAKQHRAQDRLCQISSHAQPLLQHIIDRGHALKGAVNRLN